jgi:hypothetical protein
VLREYAFIRALREYALTTDCEGIYGLCETRWRTV